MSKKELKQVMINGRLIGILGIDDAINKMAHALQQDNDAEIANNLFNEIAETNYIPVAMADAYSKALLREFKIAQGLPVETEPAYGLNIAILGMGCARCSELLSDVRDILSELKIAADLRHITDFKEIAHFRVLGFPALVINNKVVSSGDVPPKSKIRQWIMEASDPQTENN